MRDRRQIVDLWQRGDAVALVTLIRVEGSSYRRAGARLLIAANGDYAGSISGGCLEAEVIRKAQWLVRDGHAVVERYSTLFDDTADIPYGLGCGGTVDLLIEPASTPEFTALLKAMQTSLVGQTHFISTSLPSALHPLSRTIHSHVAPPASYPDPATLYSSAEVFAEVLDLPQHLILFGAGNDAQPMVRLAALMGWNVTVIDGRAQWARPERFPDAEVILSSGSLQSNGSSRNEGRLPEITSADAVVIMTHSYEQDREWLAAVLPKAPRYLGLLGARHRSALLVSEAAVILGWTVARACDGLFAPVGLDLGGDGPEAIALATVAEIQGCCEGKLGASRRLTPTVIAEQLARGDASRYLQLQCAL